MVDKKRNTRSYMAGGQNFIRGKYIRKTVMAELKEHAKDRKVKMVVRS